jgi:hypothetical protein
MVNGEGFRFRASSKQNSELELDLDGAAGSVLSDGAVGASVPAATEGSVTVWFTMIGTAVRSRATTMSSAPHFTKEAIVDSIGSSGRATFGAIG